jgi:hypothetical protein
MGRQRRSPMIAERREDLPEATSPIIQMNSPYFIYKFIFLRVMKDFKVWSDKIG